MSAEIQQSATRELVGLTIHQPWAWFIARGFKAIENRTWSPPNRIVGNWIAIHAGKHWDPHDFALTVRECSPLLPPGVRITLADLQAQLGCIVAVARVVGSVTEHDLPHITSKDRPWFVGPIGWVLDSVTAIEPVPCKGAQGLWRVPPDVLAKVRDGYARARILAKPVPPACVRGMPL